MFDFSLIPSPINQPVMGLIAQDGQIDDLHQKIAARRAHYRTLFLAKGEGWTVLTSQNTGEPPNLPWLAGAPIFLYALGSDCYCQVGYRPIVPECLTENLISALRRKFNLGNALALTAERPRGLLYDLSKARPVGETDMAALGAMS